MPSTILSDNGVSSGSAGLKTTAASDGILVLQTTTSGGTATNAIYVDNLQNVGLTAAPSAWGGVSTGRVFQTGGAAFYGRTDTPDAYMATNTYRDSSNTFRYQTTAAASFTQLSGNSLYLYSADSGTAGNAITFTQTLQVGKGLSLALQGATSQAGTGISFPATQSASSDANTLDDYEEGTWSPNFTFSGASAGMSYTSSGTYTKIGNSVRVFGRVAFTNKGSSTGSAWIQNLPFVNSVSGQPVYFIVGSLTGISSQIQMYMDNGNTVYMEVIGSGSQTVLTNSNVTNTSTFYVSVFYSV